MYSVTRKHHLSVVFLTICFSSKLSFAAEFLPGIGVGANYTDNADLRPDSKNSDVITTGFVGASLQENEGPLVYDVTGNVRKESYQNGTFEDRTYYGLTLKSDWTLFDERLNLYVRDNFGQRPIASSAANQTPDATQDSNIFVFGVALKLPISGRQQISIVPQYNRYYYEVQRTDNTQYSIITDWNYRLSRLTDVAVKVSARQIEYDDKTILDVNFFNYALIVSGQRVNSNYRLNIGSTSVERENGQATSGFSGGLIWQSELSSRSSIEAVISTSLTDTSSLASNPLSGNPDDIVVTTDVIRNEIARLSYQRADALLQSRIWTEYRNVEYSDNTALSRIVQSYGAALSFPVTPLVSSGVTLGFTNTRGVEVEREDKRFDVAANVKVIFTPKLNGSFNVRYRTKESTSSLLNYDEFSVFAGLSYGFGTVQQRTSSGLI